MKSNTAELNLRADPSLTGTSEHQFREMDLYDDLLAFSDLSPQEQEAAAIHYEASMADPTAQTPAQNVDPTTFYESQQMIEAAQEPAPHPASDPASSFFFDPAQVYAVEQASVETAEAIETAEARVAEKVEEKPPARDAAFDALQSYAFDTDAVTDFQLAEILRVTGPLPGLPAKRDTNSVLLVCAECGSAADNGEMFCIDCGGLLEEAAAPSMLLEDDLFSCEETAAPSTPLSCDDCGSMVASDEIFCPSCGSVMSGE